MSLARQKPARPRLGFLGVGWIGRHRLEALAKSGLAEVAAVADPAPQMCDAARKAAPGCEVVDDLEALLGLGLDGLVIATPSALHAEQCIRALQRGVAVFCQKPLGRSAEECRRVVDAARASDRLLGVDLSYRHIHGVPEIRHLIQTGALGDVYAVNLVFHNAYGPDKPWFYDRALAGGGCVMDLGIHLVDLALWTLGMPKVTRVASALRSLGQRPSGGSAVEDYCAATLELSNGAAAQLSCSWKLPAGADCVIEASFFGTRGGASLRNVNGSFYDFVAERFHGTQRQTLASPPDAWGGRAAIDFAQKLANGGGFDPDIESIVSVADTLDRIYSA